MLDLSELRRKAGLTQVQLAEALSTSQGQISRLERQNDMLLSTLGLYLRGIGASASILIEVGGHTVTYDLPALGPKR
jgi:transcriptional regulator with XRE-family HTH domain